MAYGFKSAWKWVCAAVVAIGAFALWAFSAGLRKAGLDDEEADRDRDSEALRRAIREGDDAEIERLWRKSQRRRAEKR